MLNNDRHLTLRLFADELNISFGSMQEIVRDVLGKQNLCAAKSKVKTMLIVIFDSRGIIHSEFVPSEQIVNGRFYRDVMDRLLKRMRRVRKEQYKSEEWSLLHDNAPAPSSIIVSQILTKKKDHSDQPSLLFA